MYYVDLKGEGEATKRDEQKRYPRASKAKTMTERLIAQT